MSTPLEERFWAKVNFFGPNGCWVWTASKRNGYGALGSNGRSLSAHKVSYQWLVGPVPVGLDLDHLCRNRACVNPQHLEAVTRGENIRRGISHNGSKTHCPQKHEYNEINTYVRPEGGRRCKICLLEAGRKYDKTRVRK